MDKKEIKTKVGDTVIRKDGLKGKVVEIFGGESFYQLVCVDYENGEMESFKSNEDNLYKIHYLIGHTVLGNKATEEELESAIKCVDYRIEELKAQKKQLRKQLWRLKEEMVEDWRERKALRELQKANKENKSTTDNQTED